MKGYFSFDWVFDDSPQPRIDFRFLFKAPGVLRTGHLADAIEASVQTVLFPDVIIVICSEDESNELRESFQITELKQAANRTAKKISLCVCSFNKEGKLSKPTFIRNSRTNIYKILQKNIFKIKRAGLNKLFSTPYVLMSAPPGFTFVKPSGERSPYFLRAEEALTEIENVQFLGFVLIDRVFAREKLLKQRIDVIYIDSMAIASVAYALREMYCALFQASRPRVVSFHSHDGLKNLEIPQCGTSFCIISASSSMRLEQRWKEKTHCLPTEVVTLLTLDTAERSADALYCLPNPFKKNSSANRTDSILKDLRITGERFLPEELVPKKVLLRGIVHSVKQAIEFACHFTGKNKLSIQARGEKATSKVRPIHLHDAALLESTSFKSYLLKILKQRTPASIQAIVYQEDDASKALAELCAVELQALMAAPVQLPLISQHQLETGNASVDASRALLIVAAVIGRGTKLLSISRDLRALHTGARTYVIGAQIAETQAQITALKGNLVYSAEKAHIIVETFTKVAVGAGLKDSYLDEHSVLSRFPKNVMSATLQDRFEKLQGSAAGLAEAGFFPCNADLSEMLRLRPDFAYWDFPYEETGVHLPAVFLTVAAILQNAREASFNSPDDRLATDAFQQVVLDPENFARYNDGVIQAALLRAAHPSELDYSSERTASQHMLAILTKIFVQHERPQGEAALEFGLAIHSGRLKLMTKDLYDLKQQVQDALQGDSLQKRVLRIFLELEKVGDASPLPEDF